MKIKATYFKDYEFACRCCGGLKIEQELVKALDQLRGDFGKPIIITSGYRCERHNANVGGVPGSFMYVAWLLTL